jgi:cation:H+ antiporter
MKRFSNLPIRHQLIFLAIILTLPAIGIMLTPWEPRQEVLAGIIITFLAALWVRLMVSRGQLKVWHLAVNGAMYITYLAIVLA